MWNAFILKGGKKEHWSLAAVPGGCKIKTSSKYVVVRTSFMNNLTIVSRDILPGLKRRITGLLPSGPKSSFQMRASFVFHLETKVLESGGRVEKLIAQVA